jgi:hypothetical protein
MQSHELCEVVFQLVNDMALGLHVDVGAGFDEVVSRSEAIGAGEEDTAERDLRVPSPKCIFRSRSLGEASQRRAHQNFSSSIYRCPANAVILLHCCHVT